MKPVVGNAEVISRPGVLVTDLYTVATYNYTGILESILRFTSFEAPIRCWSIISAAEALYATDLIFKRNSIGWKTGIDVSSVTIECRNDPDGNTMTTFIPDLLAGVYDNAVFLMDRLFLSNPQWIRNVSVAPGPYLYAPYASTDYAMVRMFSGRLGAVEGDGNGVALTVNSTMELLNIKLPKNIFAPSCVRTLYLDGCVVPKAHNAYTGTVGPGATLANIPVVMTSPPAAGFFCGGVMSPLDGQSAMIDGWYAGVAYLARELRTLPAAGTPVTLWPGCDKQLTTCRTKFNDSSGTPADFSEHFRGFPWIPVPETAV